MPKTKKKNIMRPQDFAKTIIRLFDDCYCYGVMEAEEVRDEPLLKEITELSKEHGIYRMLTSDHDMDNREWLINILLINRRVSGFDKIFFLLTEYLKVYSSMRCIIPICHDFYLQGASDYYKNPHVVDKESLKRPMLMQWDDTGLVHVKYSELLLMAQTFCFSRERVLGNEEYNNYESIKNYHLNAFSQELWAGVTKINEDRDIP